MLRRTAFTAALVAAVLLARPSLATTVYSYAGNPFTTIGDTTPPSGAYDGSMAVAGYFLLAAPLAPNLANEQIANDVLGFSFSDGRNTITDATATYKFITVFTDAGGTLTDWRVLVDRSPGSPGLAWEISTENWLLGTSDRGSVCSLIEYDPDGSCGNGQDYAVVNGAAGTWTVSVPEPRLLVALGLGVVGLSMARVRASSAGLHERAGRGGV